MQYILSESEFNALQSRISSLESSNKELKRDIAGTGREVSRLSADNHSLRCVLANRDEKITSLKQDLNALCIPLHTLKTTSSVLDAKAVDAINTMCRLLDVPTKRDNDVDPTFKADFTTIVALHETLDTLDKAIGQAKVNEFGEIER